MIKRTWTLSRWAFALLCAGAFAVSALAQGAPEPIHDALAALNERLGSSLTLNDVVWSWSQNTYADSALGCPAEGETPTSASIVGHEFTFTWEAQVYVYRVSVDQTVVRLCSVRSADEADGGSVEPFAEDAASRSNVLCGAPPEGVIFMRTRLAPGIRAQVLPGLPNNLRAAPDVSADRIGEIPAQAEFEVIAGPTCTPDGRLWWQVNYNGLIGYTVEGGDGEYFVQPALPQTIATNAGPLVSPQYMDSIPSLPIISPETMDSLSEVSRIYGSFSGGMAWASGFTLMVTGNTGSEGLWVYPLHAVTAEPVIIESSTRLTQLALSGANRMQDLVVVGADDGSIRIWNVSGDGTPVERLALTGHDDPVSAIAVSSDGRTLASVGGLAFITPANEADRQHAILLWDADTVSLAAALVGHQDTVIGIHFDRPVERLYSASLDGSLRLWNLADQTQIAALEGDVPVTAVAWSSDGDLMIAGYEDGTVSLIDAERFTSLGRFAAHEGGVRSLAFAPHNTVFASVGADGRVIVWDVPSLLAGEPRQTILTAADESEVQGVVFSPTSTYLAVLQSSNMIRFWQPVQAAG